MSRGSRIAICIIFVIIVLLGVGLIFASRLDPVMQPYDSQKTVCQFNYAIQLNPLQSRSNDCPVLQNDWLQLSVESNLNITLSILLDKVGGGQVTLYNNTSTSLNASFPIVYNGAIVSTLSNGGVNVTEANGSLSVMSTTLDNATSLTVAYPYRTIGESLIALGGLVIFIVVWNPPISGTPVRRQIPKTVTVPN